MKTKFLKKLLAGTLASACLLTVAVVKAENESQYSNGVVRLRGGSESESVTVSVNSKGTLRLRYEDLTNNETRNYNYQNVTGLIIELRGGENSVVISGNVTIDGNFTVKSDGDFVFQSRAAHTDSLNVTGNFLSESGDGTDTILFSYPEDSIDVGGDMTIDTGLYGIKRINIGNCVVVGNASVQLGGGIDSVAFGIDQSPQNGSIDGISTGGDLTIHTGIQGYADFVLVYNCVIGGDTTIHTGVGEDQVTFSNSEVFGFTEIRAGSEFDLVSFFGTSLYDGLNLRTGSGPDVVTIFNSPMPSGASVYLGNGDDELDLTNSSFFPSLYVNGGNGFDTATQNGCNFGKGAICLSVEDRDF